MTSVAGWNYYHYSKTKTNDSFSFKTLVNGSYNNEVEPIDKCSPQWCNDIEYMDTVIIPTQEKIHNIEINQEYMNTIPKHIICVDTQIIQMQETLYNKANYAKELKIKMIEINSKLDSLEKNY